MNQEDKALLEEILYEDGTRVLVEAIRELSDNMAQKLLTMSTLNVDEKTLFVEKARVEGAQQLAALVERKIEEWKTI